MRKFLDCHNRTGIVEQPQWAPHCWVNVECPDADDINLLLGDLHIPHDFIESATDPDERPRMERHDGWVLTIIRIPAKTHPHTGNPYITVPMAIIINGDVVVTVCNHRTELVDDFIAHSRERLITIDTECDFILRLLYSSTYWFLRYLKQINDHVTAASRTLQQSIHNDDLLRLMDMQKALVYFNTSVKGNEVLIDRIQRVYNPNQYDADLLDNIEVEIKQASNTVDVYSTILAGMMDSYASIISNNVNDIMKKMTGVSIVLMLPTLIASFYGMNVAIGYGGAAWAFPVIVIGSFALAIVLYFILRKINWL